jgi:hypothetical protein
MQNYRGEFLVYELDPRRSVFPDLAGTYPNPVKRVMNSCHEKSFGFERKRLISFSRLLSDTLQ